MWRRLLGQAWLAVAGEAEPPVEPTVTGLSLGGAALPSRFPVADTAIACVGTALLAGAALGSHRSVALDAGQVAAAVHSERFVRVAGRPLGPGFAPLSRFWPTRDGWVRTHGNYPWHRDALLAALDTDEAGLAAALAGLDAAEVERRVVAAGGVAAAVRTAEEWAAHPQGRAVAGQPLVADAWIAGAAPRARTRFRVLDLTTVIAGPVCTRFLAALGADVLRLDSPRRPELPLHRYDGLPGKRSASLDLADPAGLARLHELLDGADALVTGYRPGALARFGLDGPTLAREHPGLVAVSLSAWGSRGPWGDRRGFDSIVQAAVGIAARESADGRTPGALPCQLLDHGTGYLAAAAVLDGLRRQAEHGGTYLRELSLARTAHWLLDQPPAGDEAPEAGGEDAWLTTLAGDEGPVTVLTPPGRLDGAALRWPPLPIAYAAAPPAWD